MSEPSTKTKRRVDERDEERCARCGVSLWAVVGSRHHRQRRLVGGHLVENLVLLCGDGIAGCHGWAHKHRWKAVALGYIIPTWVRIIAAVPVFYGWEGRWCVLGDDGLRGPIEKESALVMMRSVFGDDGWAEIERKAA